MPPTPPIEIKGFLETSFLDWPGQVAAVLFLGGCNFRCPFCHNAGLVLSPDAFPTLSWDWIKARLGRFKGWLDGVVITGGEPTLHPGLGLLIEEIRGLGLMVKLDTNGTRPGVLSDLLEQKLLDHVAMDVKAPLEDLAYARAAGRAGWLDRVKTSLETLKNSGIPHTLRTTIVPGLHTEADLLSLAEQLGPDADWLLQRFQPDHALSPALRQVKPMDPDDFQALARRIEDARRGPVLPAADAQAEPALPKSASFPSETTCEKPANTLAAG
jgi:pyruvate formate lyase activating enzyme